MTPRGFFKDADGRLVECGFGPDGKSNGCKCVYHNAKLGKRSRFHVKAHWDSSGCPLHDPKRHGKVSA